MLNQAKVETGPSQKFKSSLAYIKISDNVNKWFNIYLFSLYDKY